MKTALAALALAALAGTASAATDTDFFNFGPSLVPFSGSDVLDKFDSAGGTKLLTGVRLTFASTLAAKVSVNSLSGPQEVSVGVIGSTSATDGLFTLPNSISGSWVSPTLNAGDFHDFGTISASDSTTINVPGILWPVYTATFAGETFGVNYSGEGLFGVLGGGNATINVIDFGGSGTVTVEYDYRVVPTPGAAALLGLGGLASLRRRR